MVNPGGPVYRSLLMQLGRLPEKWVQTALGGLSALESIADNVFNYGSGAMLTDAIADVLRHLADFVGPRHALTCKDPTFVFDAVHKGQVHGKS